MSKLDEIKRDAEFTETGDVIIREEVFFLLDRAVRQLGPFRSYAQHKVGCEVWAGAACDCGLNAILERSDDDVLDLIPSQEGGDG